MTFSPTMIDGSDMLWWKDRPHRTRGYEAKHLLPMRLFPVGGKKVQSDQEKLLIGLAML